MSAFCLLAFFASSTSSLVVLGGTFSKATADGVHPALSLLQFTADAHNASSPYRHLRLADLPRFEQENLVVVANLHSVNNLFVRGRYLQSSQVLATRVLAFVFVGFFFFVALCLICGVAYAAYEYTEGLEEDASRWKQTNAKPPLASKIDVPSSQSASSLEAWEATPNEDHKAVRIKSQASTLDKITAPPPRRWLTRPSSNVGEVAALAIPSSSSFSILHTQTVDEVKPKPLCPELVLNCAYRLTIPFEGLEQPSGDVPVRESIDFRQDSKVHFWARFNTFLGSNRGTVSVLLGEGKVMLGSAKSLASGSMEIRDRVGTYYGEMIKVDPRVNSYDLICGDKEVARLRRTGPMLTLSAVDGSTLAIAFKVTGYDYTAKQDSNQLEMKVESGVDAVLVLIVLLCAVVIA